MDPDGVAGRLKAAQRSCGARSQAKTLNRGNRSRAAPETCSPTWAFPMPPSVRPSCASFMPSIKSDHRLSTNFIVDIRESSCKGIANNGGASSDRVPSANVASFEYRHPHRLKGRSAYRRTCDQCGRQGHTREHNERPRMDRLLIVA